MEENKDAATVAAVTREHRDTDESTDKDSGAKKAGQLDTLQRKRQVKHINKLAEVRAHSKKRVLKDQGFEMPTQTITTKPEFDRFLQWIQNEQAEANPE